MCLIPALATQQSCARCAVMQVVSSYLNHADPDLESSQAAFEAYFAEPLQSMAAAASHHSGDDSTGLAFFKSQAAKLADLLSQAQNALTHGDAASLQHILLSQPATHADLAPKDAISIIEGLLQRESCLQRELLHELPGGLPAVSPHLCVTLCSIASCLFELCGRQPLFATSPRNCQLPAEVQS